MAGDAGGGDSVPRAWVQYLSDRFSSRVRRPRRLRPKTLAETQADNRELRHRLAIMALVAVLLGLLCVGMWLRSRRLARLLYGETGGTATAAADLAGTNHGFGGPQMHEGTSGPRGHDGVQGPGSAPAGPSATNLPPAPAAWFPIYRARVVRLLAAIREVEGDDGRTGSAGEIGPYRITRDYYTDAWRDVAAFERPGFGEMRSEAPAAEAVLRYMHRFEPLALTCVECELPTVDCSEKIRALARLHHGGPRWRQKPWTADYGDRVANLVTALEAEKRDPR